MSGRERRGVRLRPLRAWLIYAGLTVPIGLFGHVLFEQIGGVVRRTGSVEWDHTLLAVLAAAMFGLTVAALRRGSAQERRRRLAMLGSQLPGKVTLALAGCGLQAALAGGTLAVEGVGVDPARFSIALAVSILAVLLGSIVFSAIDDDVLAFIAAIVVLAAQAGQRDPLDCGDAAIPRSTFRPARLRAGRAPPLRRSPVTA